MEREVRAGGSSTGDATHQADRDAEAVEQTAAAGPEGERPDEATDPAPEVEVIERDPSSRALLAELVPPIALLIVAGYLFYLAGDFKGQSEPGQLGPAFWPRMAATGMAIAILVGIVQTVRAHKRPIVRLKSQFDEDETLDAPIDNTRLAIAIALAVGYVFATMFLGYLIATAVFLTAFIWIGGQRRWYVPLIAIAGSLVSVSVFIGIVYVSLPTGVGIFDTITVAIYELLGIQ
jgi:putative tricarboxylic transport membrane protein